MYRLIVEYIMDRKIRLAELTTMADFPVVNQGVFTVIAKIDCIYLPGGWCYVSCLRCSKKIQSIGGLFVCNICDTICRYPIVRYSIQLCVSDPTGKSILTIFNRLGEKLLDSSANKFFNRLPADQFPQPVIDLAGRFFSFKVRLPDYANVDPDFHNFRVVGMAEVESPPDFEVQVGLPNKCVTPGCSGPSKAVDSSGSTNKGSTNLGVPTPEKKCNTKKRIKVDE